MSRHTDPRNIALRDQILAALREEAAAVSTERTCKMIAANCCIHANTPCAADRCGWRRWRLPVYSQLIAMSRLGLVEKTNVDGRMDVYWRYLPSDDAGESNRVLAQREVFE